MSFIILVMHISDTKLLCRNHLRAYIYLTWYVRITVVPIIYCVHFSELFIGMYLRLHYNK